MTPLLFVYGTLKSRSRHPAAARLRDESRWLGPAQTQGRLYGLGAYPALVASPAPGCLVSGEVFELLSPPGSLPWLDAYEGSEYHRRVAPVRLSGGAIVLAWCYFYTGSLSGRTPLESALWDLP